MLSMTTWQAKSEISDAGIEVMGDSEVMKLLTLLNSMCAGRCRPRVISMVVSTIHDMMRLLRTQLEFRFHASHVQRVVIFIVVARPPMRLRLLCRRLLQNEALW